MPLRADAKQKWHAAQAQVTTSGSRGWCTPLTRVDMTAHYGLTSVGPIYTGVTTHSSQHPAL